MATPLAAARWLKLAGHVPTLLLMKEMKTRSLDPVTPTAPLDWKGYHESEV